MFITSIIFLPFSPSNFFGYIAATIIINRSLLSWFIIWKFSLIFQHKIFRCLTLKNRALTWLVLKNLITSFLPASPKTMSCSSWPSSLRPCSMIVLLIVLAICNEITILNFMKKTKGSTISHQSKSSCNNTLSNFFQRFIL